MYCRGNSQSWSHLHWEVKDHQTALAFGHTAMRKMWTEAWYVAGYTLTGDYCCGVSVMICDFETTSAEKYKHNEK